MPELNLHSDPGYVSRTHVADAYQLTPVSFSVTAVPEPGTFAMMAAGLGLAGFMSRRRSAGRS